MGRIKLVVFDLDGKMCIRDRLCDYLVKIPIYGKAESLNAAVAAGVLLYRCKEGR